MFDLQTHQIVAQTLSSVMSLARIGWRLGGSCWNARKLVLEFPDQFLNSRAELRLVRRTKHRLEHRLCKPSVSSFDLCGHALNVGSRSRQPFHLAATFAIHLRRNNFHSTDENPGELGRLGFDVELKYRIRHASRNDVEDPQSLFEPRVAPCLDHRSRFSFVEPLTNEDRLEIAFERVNGLIVGWPLEANFVVERVNNLISDPSVTVREQYERCELMEGGLLHQHLLSFKPDRKR